MSEIRVLFLFGPTGVGKTQLLLDLLPGQAEVVTVDSIQVYRGLNIGSAKPTLQEREILPHHLIDICDPSEQFDVGDFFYRANLAVQDIALRGLIPVLAGGTAFYFRSFLFGLAQAPRSDPVIRQKVDDEWKEKGEMLFRQRLAQIDPFSEKRIKPHDAYRLKRAFEVFLQTGRALSSFQVQTKPRAGFDTRLIGLTRPREELIQRISQRVDKMIQDGLIDEIKGLLEQGVLANSPAFRGIGYAEFLPWLLKSQGNLKEAIELVKKRSCQYAKRQATFFRSLANVEWITAADQAELKKVLMSLT